MRNLGKTVVQATCSINGHVPHIHATCELGDLLVVTITTDRFVNKGSAQLASDRQVLGCRNCSIMCW
jgi:hypothetical protein